VESVRQWTDVTEAGESTALVKAAVEGDRDAFRLLVQPHLEIALRAAHVIVGSEVEARDAVQDGLLLAWRDIRKLRDPRAFPAWFRQIVVRASIRRAKARHRLLELDVELSDSGRPLERALEQRTLARAFAALDPDDRAVLTVRHLWDLSVAESAAVLRLPEGTVKSRTHRAMERLRAAYESEERR
jgi:RNA polymerase sigma-70 factor (ECF subfamily)